jgi:superfamily I DNA and/or RNA helicase
MMMDDLTQEEIKIIMDLRKVEIDNKIKIDKEKIDNIHKYTNVWDEGVIIESNFKETKGEPIKDDPIKDDPIKSYLDGNMTNEEIIKKINTHKYNYNLLRIMLEMPETIYIYSDSDLKK